MQSSHGASHYFDTVNPGKISLHSCPSVPPGEDREQHAARAIMLHLVFESGAVLAFRKARHAVPLSQLDDSKEILHSHLFQRWEIMYFLQPGLTSCSKHHSR